MDLKDLLTIAIEVKKKYAAKNRKQWGAAEYMQGFVGDVGDLAKLVMAKQGLRKVEGINKKLVHELSDCLWSILVLADEFNIDLEKGFLVTMNELEVKIDKN